MEDDQRRPGRDRRRRRRTSTPSRSGPHPASRPASRQRLRGRLTHPPASPGSGPTIEFARSNLAIPWSDDYASLLELAEACDVPVRWSCRTGVCHNCETTLIAGAVDYNPDPVEPPADGSALICCSRPHDGTVRWPERRSRPALGVPRHHAAGDVQRRRLRHHDHAARPRDQATDRRHDLLHGLVALWPSYLAYAVTFLFIGQVWANHHVMFDHVRAADRVVLLLNTLLLMVVAFLPFATSVLAEALRSGHGQRTAVCFYGIAFGVTALTFNAVWQYARRHRLLSETLGDAGATAIGRRFQLALAWLATGAAAGRVAPRLGRGRDRRVQRVLLAPHPGEARAHEPERVAEPRPGRSAGHGRAGFAR